MATPTLRHCVLGAFTDEATDAQKEEMVQAMRAMAAKIPQICSLVVGLDAGLAPGNHGFAANVDAGKVAVSKNGSWSDEGCGVMLEGDAFKVGVYPAFSINEGKVRHCLVAPFKHDPPEAGLWGGV